MQKLASCISANRATERFESNHVCLVKYQFILVSGIGQRLLGGLRGARQACYAPILPLCIPGPRREWLRDGGPLFGALVLGWGCLGADRESRSVHGGGCVDAPLPRPVEDLTEIPTGLSHD